MNADQSGPPEARQPPHGLLLTALRRPGRNRLSLLRFRLEPAVSSELVTPVQIGRSV
jgi:hypothetical protein